MSTRKKGDNEEMKKDGDGIEMDSLGGGGGG